MEILDSLNQAITHDRAQPPIAQHIYKTTKSLMNE